MKTETGNRLTAMMKYFYEKSRDWSPVIIYLKISVESRNVCANNGDIFLYAAIFDFLCFHRRWDHSQVAGSERISFSSASTYLSLTCPGTYSSRLSASLSTCMI